MVQELCCLSDRTCAQSCRSSAISRPELCDLRQGRAALAAYLVSWCLKPSQPQGNTSGLTGCLPSVVLLVVAKKKNKIPFGLFSSFFLGRGAS